MKRLTELQEIRNNFALSQSSQTSDFTETDDNHAIVTDGDDNSSKSLDPEAALAQPAAVATATSDIVPIPNFAGLTGSTDASTSSNSTAATSIPISTPVPPPFLRRHTSIGAVPASGGKWEERAAAFMMKRRSMQAAMNASPISDSRISPKLGMVALGGIGANGFYSPPHLRQFAKLPPTTRPVLHRMLSERDVQEVSWEFERSKLNPRRGALIAAAWESYQDAWDDLLAEQSQTEYKDKDDHQIDSGPEQHDNDVDDKDEKKGNNSHPYLTFAKIPWPLAQMSHDPPITDPKSINIEGMREFLLSPFHSTDKSKETRIREAYMLWHPDKSTRWLPLVLESEREAVQMGVERVNWCLNNLKVVQIGSST